MQLMCLRMLCLSMQFRVIHKLHVDAWFAVLVEFKNHSFDGGRNFFSQNSEN